MKTLVLLLTIWGVLGLVQCSKEDSVIRSQSQDVKLKVNEAVQLREPNNPVRLTLTKLQDARCPAKAECVWQGQAEVVAELRDAAGASQTAALCLGACRNDSVAVQLGTRTYALKLQEVTPYPNLAQLPGLGSVAHLRIVPQ